MSLHFETRWQDDEGKWVGFRRVDVINGRVLLDPDVGPLISVDEAIALARPSSHLPIERRPYALRIGFSR